MKLEDFIKLEQIINSIGLEMRKDNWETKKDKFINDIKIDNEELSKNFSSIFIVIEKKNFDLKELQRLGYMINMAKKVHLGNMKEHDASVAVGQVLVDEIVKPQLKK